MKPAWILVASFAALAAMGCQPKNTQVAAQQETKPYRPLSEMESSSVDTTAAYEQDPYATDPIVSGHSATPRRASQPDPILATPDDSAVEESSESTATPAEPETTLIPAAGVQTHVVKKGETLFKLSRKYYGTDRRWREIWEANQNRVPNPDKLPVGIKLIIP